MSNPGKLFSLKQAVTHGVFNDSNPSSSIYEHTDFLSVNSDATTSIEITEANDTLNRTDRCKFRLPQNVHYLGEKYILKGTFDARAAPGLGQHDRFVNWAARLQIDYVIFRAGHSQKNDVRIPGELFHLEHYIQTSLRDKEAQAVMELGDLTPIDRDALALTDQNWETRIWLPFDVSHDQFLPVSLFQNEPEIEIHFKDDEEILDCNIPNYDPVVRSNLRLQVDTIIVHPEEYYSASIAPVMNNIVSMYKRDCQYENTLIELSDLDTQNRIVIPLKTYNHETAAIFCTLRYEDETLIANNTGFDNLQDWEYYTLRDGSTQVQEPVYWMDQVYRRNVELTYYPVGLNMMIYNFAKDIIDRKHVSGSKNLSGFTKGEFVIKPTADMLVQMGLGRKVVVDLQMLVHNIILITSKSNNPMDPMIGVVDRFDVN